jgi:nitrite reductase/ring-hydroxylating ferredoxin subunit
MAGKRIKVAAAAEIVDGKLLAIRAEGRKILLARIGGRVHAVIDRCPHMGMSLAKGKLADGVVSCPWHNSRFDFCSGRNLDWVSAVLGVPMPQWTHKAIAMGKSPAPLQTLPVEEVNGEVFVSVPG